MNATETKHSPLPWRAQYDTGAGYDIIGSRPTVGDASGHVAVVSGPKYATKANADLIVQAVNSHAALVEACKAVARTQSCGVCRGEYSARPGARLSACCKVRAALALAGKGE